MLRLSGGMRVNQAIERRVLLAADYIASSGATVRQAARVLGVSKSTVHKDLQTRLPQLSAPLAREVAAVLGKNKAERHLRGGEATRKRYARLREAHEQGAGRAPSEYASGADRE